jgi:hypothetical protein
MAQTGHFMARGAPMVTPRGENLHWSPLPPLLIRKKKIIIATLNILVGMFDEFDWC